MSKEELPSKELAEALAAMADKPWCEIHHGKPITQYWLARRLKDFGIRPLMIGPKTKRVSGYKIADFQDAFARYLPEKGIPTSHPHTINKFNDLGKTQTSHRKNGCKVGNSANLLISNKVCGC